jgi:hypothetical protein
MLDKRTEVIETGELGRCLSPLGEVLAGGRASDDVGPLFVELLEEVHGARGLRL